MKYSKKTLGTQTISSQNKRSAISSSYTPAMHPSFIGCGFQLIYTSSTALRSEIGIVKWEKLFNEVDAEDLRFEKSMNKIRKTNGKKLVNKTECSSWQCDA